jgi:endonuclease G, mitochondrial
VMKNGAQELVLRYHHYSLSMHKSRRFCLWAASILDYDENKRRHTREEWGTDAWKLDPRIAGEKQIEGAELYDPAKKFDQGHIVRRDDVAWGETASEEEFANSDSFHYTNCTPQHEDFNRAVFQFKGLWGQLENHITEQAGFLQNRLIVFAGPALLENDPTRDFGLGADIQIPIQFWKVIIAMENAETVPVLRAYGFVLSQKKAIADFGWENRFRAGQFAEYQESLANITELTGVAFAQVVLDADILALEPDETRRRPLRSLEDIRLR